MYPSSLESNFFEQTPLEHEFLRRRRRRRLFGVVLRCAQFVFFPHNSSLFFFPNSASIIFFVYDAVASRDRVEQRFEHDDVVFREERAFGQFGRGGFLVEALRFANTSLSSVRLQRPSHVSNRLLCFRERPRTPSLLFAKLKSSSRIVQQSSSSSSSSSLRSCRRRRRRRRRRRLLLCRSLYNRHRSKGHFSINFFSLLQYLGYSLREEEEEEEEEDFCTGADETSSSIT